MRELLKLIKKTEGGIAIVLLWSIIFFIIMLVSTFAIEVYYTNVKAEIVKDAVTMASLSVYKSIDIEQLENGEIIINESIVNTFKEYLAKNLRLNGDLSARPNSIVIGKVEIVDFTIYNRDSIEEFYPNSQPIYYKPSLYVRIKYDIKPMLRGILGNTKTVYTSATADLIPDK